MRYDKSLPQLRILQINAARSPSPHEAALQLTFEQEYHVVLVQEPWISNFRERRLSKHHPAFELFTPIEDWSNRARTLTYIQKHPQLKAELVPHSSQPSRDLTAVQVARIFVGYPQLGLGSRPDIQHAQFADLDVVQVVRYAATYS